MSAAAPPATKKVQHISLIDGLAILLIVVVHCSYYYNAIGPVVMIGQYLGEFGIALFTFTAGYKLAYNHFDKFRDREFMGAYFLKRFVKLIKPYYGYTLLIFIPYYITLWTASNVLHWDFAARYQIFFQQLSLQGLFDLVTGYNFVALHLWYLVALAVVTAVTFTVVTFTGRRGLIVLFVPVLAANIFLYSAMISFSTNFFRIMLCMPFFITGIYYAIAEREGQRIVKYVPYFSLAILPLAVGLFGLPGFPRWGGIMMVWDFAVLCLMLGVANAGLRLPHISSALLFCSLFSFPIYIFHAPFISAIYGVIITRVLGIETILGLVPMVALAILTSIGAYKAIQKIHLNWLIE